MNETEFIRKLDELKNHSGRLLIYCIVVILFTLPPFVYVVYLARNHAPISTVLQVGCAAMALWSFCVWLLLLAFRRNVEKYAPKCPSCGSKATWQNRSQILATGHCPQCHAEFVNISNR